MSRVYDSWEKLVGAVLDREELRRLALSDSFSSISTDFSSRLSIDSSAGWISEPSNWDVGFQTFNDIIPGVHKQMDEPGPSNWNVGFHPINDINPVSRISSQKFDPAELSTQNIFFFRNVMAIEYEEIKKATENFRPDMLLGDKGFGPTFKGWIHEHYLTAMKRGSGIAVAVKKMNYDDQFPGHNEWETEINYLSQLRHPNLIKLIGYSFDKDNKVVVHEFMPKGNLADHLFTKEHQSLPWATRMKVAVGAAEALAFLHNLETPFIHRDFKSDNILLDEEFNPKLSEFALGLAIDSLTGDMIRAATPVVGTYCYVAPEYVATGNLNTRCDVYGFGVVLLELISGLRVFDSTRPIKKCNLVDWARPCLLNKRRLSRVMDCRLDGQYPPREAYKVGKLHLQCVSSDPRLRPTMVAVLAALKKL